MTVKKLVIKPLTKEDIERVSEIEASAYGEHHWSKDAFYSEVNNKVARYFTASLEDGLIVGYIGLWHIVDEAHITTIATDKEFLRNKIAESLIVKSLQDCYNKFIKYITLEVRVSNTPAIKLYKKYGFKSLGTRKGYYQDNNEDALIMWTENIFSDEYKSMFAQNVSNLEKLVTIE